jgi:hypothetical protein
MNRLPQTAAVSAQPDQASVFRVESAGLSGWVVYRVGDQKVYRFLTQDLAVGHARTSAQDRRPSVVVVIEADGTLVKGWEFPCETDGVA